MLEIPTNWYLDDFPPLAYVTGIQPGQQDYGHDLPALEGHLRLRLRPGRATPATRVAVHPQIIGQAHHMMWFERLIEHIATKEGVWFATCEEIARAWVDDDEDERLMELEDVRGVEDAPVGSGWR